MKVILNMENVIAVSYTETANFIFSILKLRHYSHFWEVNFANMLFGNTGFNIQICNVDYTKMGALS